MREFSGLAILLGVVIGVVFGVANGFVGMKVGLTVGASIPAAVISMAILRGLLKRGTLLENNMVQTIGSAGESLAAGMIFTIPALYIFAAQDPAMAPHFVEMVIWGALGGLLGVIFMIPLRRMLIVKEHGALPFPEGTACAEVLQSGQRGGAGARLVFGGLGVAALYEFFRGLGFWRDEAVQRLPLLRTDLSLATEPALLGVGYILGVRIAGYMLGGAVLGWFVIIPAIGYFGAGVETPLAPEPNLPISQMEPGLIWSRYLRYIGAGAVVLGGLVSLLKSLGTIGGSIFQLAGGRGTRERTDRDLPLIVLLVMLVGIGAALWYLPTVEYTDAQGQTQHLMHGVLRSVPVIACIIGFAFFFVTVSARLVGIVGSSSNPASGMTIATLLGTSLILVYGMGLEGTSAKIAILTVGAFVCIAICIAGDTSQDLKTGYLVKATPWKQQLGEMIAVLTSAAAMAWLIQQTAKTYGFDQETNPNALLVPQANLMKLLVEGVVDKGLPWELILVGMAAALVIELLGIPSLPFAVGLYLPLSLSTPIMAGGLLRWVIDLRRNGLTNEAENPGVLAASGLVAGQGIVGVLFVGVAALIGWGWNDPRFVEPKYHEEAQVWANYDPTVGTWTYPDPQTGATVYLHQQDNRWSTNAPPIPLVDPAEPSAPALDGAPPGDATRDEAERPPAEAERPPSTRESTAAPATPEPAPAPGEEAGEPQEQSGGPRPLAGEPVVAKHLYPWLTTKVGFLQPEYGLRPLALETGPFRDEYRIDWWRLLPLAPFAALVIWLGVAASRRIPPEIPRERLEPAPRPPTAPRSKLTKPEPDPFSPTPLDAEDEAERAGDP